MTREEFMRIASIIGEIWPEKNPIKTKFQMELWFRNLQDMSYEQAETILYQYMVTSRFPIDISDFRLATVPEGMTEDEAWAMVHKAIQNSSYSSKEEFDKLPPDIQKAVGSPMNLRAMALDEDFNLGVASSNFKRSYRQVKEQSDKLQALPERLRLEVNKLFLGGTE